MKGRDIGVAGAWGGRVDLQPSASVHRALWPWGQFMSPFEVATVPWVEQGAALQSHLLASGRGGRTGGLLPPPAREPLG